jgi:hypothetical protein
MSENTLKLHGNRIRYQFVRSSFNAVLQDSRLHEVWRQADTLLDEINTRCQLGDDLKVKSQNFYVLWEKSTMRSPLKDDFKTREDGKQLKYDFFQVSVREVPQSYPTASNSVAWNERNATQPLPPRTRQHVDFTSSSQFFSAVVGPVNKKRKFASDQSNETQIVEMTPTSSLLITTQEPSPQWSS